MQALAAIVAVEALPVLHVHRRAPRLGEADQRAVIGWRLRVQRAGTVARFADTAFELGLRILVKDLGMQCVRELQLVSRMAARARLLADEAGRRGCRRLHSG